ncbi:MAG: hypothetical protein OHK0039_41210 [Bacteroidia bacterium]
MKTGNRSVMRLIAAACLLTLFLPGCVSDVLKQTMYYMSYQPVYMSQDDFLNAVRVSPARDLVNPGKIYLKDQYLFVGETAQGVHVFDNSNPASPQALAFIEAPGNYDMVFNCDMLYLDSSTDLLVFDMSTPQQPTLVRRLRNALPHMLSYRGFNADPAKGIVVEWKATMLTAEYTGTNQLPAEWVANEVDPVTVDPSMRNGNTRTINPAVPGKGGSMSRFALLDNHLYIVSPSELFVYKASNCEAPVPAGKVDILIGQGEAEMVSTLEDKLLIGGTTGIAIYGTSNPEMPDYLSSFEHIESCDPIVGQGRYAYITLRDGSDQPCDNNFTNQLDVLDLSNISWPRHVATFPMTHPHGLGIDGNLLFIADGDAGLRVFDASDPLRVGQNQIAHFPDMNGYDVIAHENLLIFTGKDGIALYDYSDVQDIRLLGSIPVVVE